MQYLWEMRLLADVDHHEAIVERWHYLREQSLMYLLELERHYSDADLPKTQFSRRSNTSRSVVSNRLGGSGPCDPADRHLISIDQPEIEYEDFKRAHMNGREGSILDAYGSCSSREASPELNHRLRAIEAESIRSGAEMPASVSIHARMNVKTCVTL